MLTNPPISVAQNRNDSVRKVAAQARLYADVKTAQWSRLGAVAVLGVVVAVVSLTVDDDGLVGSVGGLVLLFINGILMYRERRQIDLAVSVQESFDCSIFDLAWNDVAFKHRPSGQQIARAADRYSGSRTRNWYPDTGTLQRPLDIVVCQQSNVGWGAPVHRLWAWTVLAITVFFALVIATLWWVAGLEAGAGFGALVAPFTPLAWEAFEMVRQNFESAAEKEDTQSRILEDWDLAMSGHAVPTEGRVRHYQDAIAGIRKRNAQVPDWFDKRLRSRNERAMRTTADDMIAQAQRAGLA
ncbi:MULTISPECIES: S-4TM family putative pore-forming effector [Rhodococcus]|uniref:S-4TM family putative pore-forming effector n=1 Tax=Rhodococcus TaxID=1827 RepID=UPI0012F6B858|nr:MULTISPECIES: S-4TM family putative pore-forming effector [Rhodococcus]